MAAAEISQALVGLAAILISLFTFVISSNDRRHRDDAEELREARATIERLQQERDHFERRYFEVLEENARLRRGGA